MVSSNEIKPISDIKLHEKLPEPIKIMVKGFWTLVNTSDYNVGIKSITAVLPIFKDESTLVVWQNLLSLKDKDIKKSSDDNGDKFKHFNMENHIDYVLGQIDYLKWKKDEENKILKKINKLLEHYSKFLLSTTPGVISFNDNNFIKALLKEKETIEIDIQRIKSELKDNKNFQTQFMPITRQSKNTGREILYAAFLSVVFRQLYGKPRYEDVASLINVLHKRVPYSGQDIFNIVNRSQKRVAQKEPPSPIQNLFETFLSGFPFPFSVGLWEKPNLKPIF